MFIERMFIAFSILTITFALGYAGSAAVGTQHEAPAVVAPRPLDARQLVKKLDKLEHRLAAAQHSIDDVLGALVNATEDSQRDASRVRLDVLYRLETGLTTDIARVRTQLSSRGITARN